MGKHIKTEGGKRHIHWFVNNNQNRCLSSLFLFFFLNQDWKQQIEQVIMEESKINIHKGKCRTPDIYIVKHTTPQSYTPMFKDHTLFKINFFF